MSSRRIHHLEQRDHCYVLTCMLYLKSNIANIYYFWFYSGISLINWKFACFSTWLFVNFWKFINKIISKLQTEQSCNVSNINNWFSNISCSKTVDKIICSIYHTLYIYTYRVSLQMLIVTSLVSLLRGVPGV